MHFLQIKQVSAFKYVLKNYFLNYFPGFINYLDWASIKQKHGGESRIFPRLSQQDPRTAGWFQGIIRTSMLMRLDEGVPTVLSRPINGQWRGLDRIRPNTNSHSARPIRIPQPGFKVATAQSRSSATRSRAKVNPANQSNRNTHPANQSHPLKTERTTSAFLPPRIHTRRRCVLPWLRSGSGVGQSEVQGLKSHINWCYTG
jgi:hypothetical protein